MSTHKTTPPTLTPTDAGDRRALLKRVRRIEIVTRRTVNDVLAGAYHSVYKGQGMEFEAVRRYEPGDDIRAIDWNVSARMGEPYIKVFREERELTQMLLVDLSASQGFGSRSHTKAELAAELAALLAFSGIQNNDKVGLILFTDKVERFIPPERGRKHVLRVISEILSYRPTGKGTSLTAALQFLNRLKVRRSVAFLISDFQDSGYERELRLASGKHDLVAFCLEDPMETLIPPALGLVRIEDPETGDSMLIDAADTAARRWLEGLHQQRGLARDAVLRRLSVDTLTIETDAEDQQYLVPLVRFFKRRARHRGR